MRSLSTFLLAGWMLMSAVASDNNFYPGPGCLACKDRDLYKEITKQTIKEEILRKLGFSSPPSNTNGQLYSSLPFVRKKIEELERQEEEGYMNDWIPGFHDQFDEDDYHFQPKSVSILPSKRVSLHPSKGSRTRFKDAQVKGEALDDVKMPRSAPLYLGYPVLYFKLSENVVGSRQEIDKSLLSIHLPAAPSKHETRAIIHVYYVSQDKTGKTFLSPAKENTVQLRTDIGGRVEIDLKHLTRIWMKNPSENLGISIKVQIENSRSELEIGRAGTAQGPYLQIDIEDGSWRSRVKRTTNRVCSEEFDPSVTQCCMWPLQFNFTEYNWDWVLFPKTFFANFCSGDCSPGVVVEYPHTNLIQMSETKHNSTVGPCCAPRKMSAINMLYLDADQNVIVGKIPNMKVERCGCS